MQGITSPQRRPLSQAEPDGDLEILHSQGQALEPLFAQHQKSLPGDLRFLPCDRASANLKSQGSGGVGFAHQGPPPAGLLLGLAMTGDITSYPARAGYTNRIN